MSFNAPRASVSQVPTDIKKDIQKRELQASIDVLGSVLDDLKKEIERKTKDNEKLVDVSRETKEKEAKLDEITTSINVLEGKLSSRQKDLEQLAGLREKIIFAQAELDNLEAKKAVFNVLEDKITASRATLKDLEDNFTKRSAEILKEVSEVSEKKNAELELLDNAKKELSNTNKSLTSANKQFEDLGVSINEKTQEVIGLINKYETTKSELEVKAKKDREVLDLELDAVRSAHLADIEAREAKMVEREGAASIKESWIIEKEQSLLATKADLEKYYNRKINIII